MTAGIFAPECHTEGAPLLRLAQPEYLPAHLVVEVKRYPSRVNWLETDNSLAFLTAYLLHERLLFEFLSQYDSVGTGRSFHVEDIYIHALSLCGTVAKVWRMGVEYDGVAGSPIRYLMHLIEKLDTKNTASARKLRKWINAIYAHAQAVVYPKLEQAFKDYRSLHKAKETAHLQNVGFIYVRVADGRVEIEPRPLDDLQRDFRNRTIKSCVKLGLGLMTNADPQGNMTEVVADFGSSAVEDPTLHDSEGAATARAERDHIGGRGDNLAENGEDGTSTMNPPIFSTSQVTPPSSLAPQATPLATASSQNPRTALQLFKDKHAAESKALKDTLKDKHAAELRIFREQEKVTKAAAKAQRKPGRKRKVADALGS
ncbi:hypothetical protein EJ08DRAFT_665862 [Tothia fuscella]|uniref:Uncharacterized protein n=1 Tax=Tothia fuscella TaxID=1048955 RepID=A0A9P4NFR4_9PEZI|nr:hypothetical protein EJ08DRAFT_665862 [Tothia fuscella]